MLKMNEWAPWVVGSLFLSLGLLAATGSYWGQPLPNGIGGAAPKDHALVWCRQLDEEIQRLAMVNLKLERRLLAIEKKVAVLEQKVRLHDWQMEVEPQREPNKLRFEEIR